MAGTLTGIVSLCDRVFGQLCACVLLRLVTAHQSATTAVKR